MNKLLIQDLQCEKFVIYFDCVEDLSKCLEIFQLVGGMEMDTYCFNEYKEDIMRGIRLGRTRAIRWDGGTYNSTEVRSYVKDGWFSRIKYGISSADFLKYINTNIVPELIYSKAMYKRNTI